MGEKIQVFFLIHWESLLNNIILQVDDVNLEVPYQIRKLIGMNDISLLDWAAAKAIDAFWWRQNAQQLIPRKCDVTTPPGWTTAPFLSLILRCVHMYTYTRNLQIQEFPVWNALIFNFEKTPEDSKVKGIRFFSKFWVEICKIYKQLLC